MEPCQGSYVDAADTTGLTESAICCICEAADESCGCIKEAIKLLEADVSCYPQPSESRRKFTLKKSIGKLAKATAQVEGIRTQVLELREEVHSLQEKLKHSQGAHLEALHRMDVFAIDMQGTLLRVREEEDVKNKLMQELKETSGSAETAREKLRLAEIEHELRLKDFSKLLTEDVHLRSENERLNRELHEREARMEESDVAQKNASKAMTQLEQYKEVIARITADNMVFLMKLKQSEASLVAAEEQVANLQNERASWLEEASSEIQDAVRLGLSKTESSETELELLHRERHELENKLQASVERVTKLIKSKERLEERLTCLEDENAYLQKKLESESKERQNAEAEARVLLSSLKQSNYELVEAKRQYEISFEELQEKNKSISEKQEKIENLFVALKNSSLQLETQQAINAAIMKKKEQMEWRCLEAEAHRDKLRNKLRGRTDTG